MNNEDKKAEFEDALITFMVLYADYTRENQLASVLIAKINRMKENSRNYESARLRKRAAKDRADKYRQQYIAQKNVLVQSYSEALGEPSSTTSASVSTQHFAPHESGSPGE